MFGRAWLRLPSHTVGHTLYFIQLQGSLGQPRAQGFTKYIGQPSPAPLLESALAGSCLWRRAPLPQPLR